MVKLGDVNPLIWDEITESMEHKLRDFKFKAEKIAFDWRISAASKKLERELFEQYGPWKDLILHPTFQYVKQIVESNIDFRIQSGEPLIPIATSIVILFMMYKRVNHTVLGLIGGLLMNINPFYLFISAIVWNLFNQTRRPKQYKRSKVLKTLNLDKAIKYSDSIFKETYNYDHILIGNDIGTLYCAALLSQAGHKCCVLQPRGVLPLEVSTSTHI